mmetsp:Transcript_6074/g.8857  ORF Transcript_6074/g.8857 Transcript_6074/m.8857 type:complete len:209 (+) Transcript_6074:172-798(+)|eukprot:CAMPEP_0201687776 /NCGR_PEP_ID=MMETSP0578-20130828/1682_1 /ASSEMBLY_ACC=CAM_ASM_000663 /TAXON_ID=267565 /ORGANISM="Skeletonema grethea, Strain CCMP 1804" /LENGTH=208 /DNA_ID=CAMNT_0048171951 /DNA_START=191 /DNA_END=817 /DNA_ORIENTATION=+
MRKKWKKKIESVSHRQQYPSDSSSASESSVSEDSCSSEQQETTPYARSDSSLNPLRWRNQTFDVDGTVEPQESNYCRHRKGIQADFQRDENKETNVAVSNAPPEANSFIEANPSKEQLYALTNAVLKEKLRERGLKRTGKKEDLVNRLLEDFDASSTESKKLIGKKKDELKHLLTERGLLLQKNLDTAKRRPILLMLHLPVKKIITGA